MPGRRSLITRSGIIFRLQSAILTHTALDTNHPAPLMFDLLVQSVKLAVKPISLSDPNVSPIPMLAIYTHVHQLMTLIFPRNGNEKTRLPRTRNTLQQSTHDSICLL